ncbi:MAG: hypothetical protein HOJ35_04780 [Bdellovibrionales bacterium]|jgi:hypothetical protein|nr:hypothetical protein [Bdellovibrionales bacterium]
MFKSILTIVCLLTTTLVFSENLTCITGGGSSCSELELSQPKLYKQILVLPTGYQENEKEKFIKDFNSFVMKMSTAGENVYSQIHKDQIFYIYKWVPGGAMDSKETSFDAQVLPHPIRKNFGLVINQNKIHDFVDSHNISPWAVTVIFNTSKSATANAKPPTFIQKKYGILLMTSAQSKSSYIGTHEVAHAALDFLDEYVESGFENLNISLMNKLSAMAVYEKGWSGFKMFFHHVRGNYRINISDILAANGPENIDTTKFPSRVITDGYIPNIFEYEGGMFFGKGTFHDRGNNLMNSNRVKKGKDDGFGYDHSESQKSIIEQAFVYPEIASRPNDRIRNAGPVGKLRFSVKKNINLLLFDGDKNHHFHPTTSYDLQVGWYERSWKWCKKSFIKYPCRSKKWTSFEKTFNPTRLNISLKLSKLYGTSKLLLFLGCRVGIAKVFGVDKELLKRFCQHSIDTLADAFVPTLEFLTPYQFVNVPVTQHFTKYYWRFRTDNGTFQSGWTGWTKFTKSL